MELYNLAEDVGESRDLAEAQPAKAAQLLAKLEAWRSEVDAQPPVANPGAR